MREAIALSLAPAAPAVDPELEAALALSMQTPSAAGGAATGGAAVGDDGDAELQAVLALSMQQAAETSKAEASAADIAMAEAEPDDDTPEPEPTAEGLGRFVFGDSPSPAALKQWHSQGICLGSLAHEMSRAASSDDSGAAVAVPFGAGILQEQGGPCAVLAAAQGFLLRRLLFDPDASRPQPEPAWRDAAGDEPLLPSDELATDALLSGLTDMLWGAATARRSHPPPPDAPPPRCVVALLPAEQLPFGGSPAELRAALLLPSARVVAESWGATRDALRQRLPALEAEHGALSFLYSAVLSRGVERFRRERDDGDEPLLHPTFGYCAQEVLNLLLTGFGVSNVFDGNRDLGGMVMRGISARPKIGILSELEALRYVEVARPEPSNPLLHRSTHRSTHPVIAPCPRRLDTGRRLCAAQVGSLFKQPTHPLWVVASESHYSLLFSLSGAVQHTSPLATLEEGLLRAFSAYDSEGNGFVSSEVTSPTRDTAAAVASASYSTPPPGPNRAHPPPPPPPLQPHAVPGAACSPRPAPPRPAPPRRRHSRRHGPWSGARVARLVPARLCDAAARRAPIQTRPRVDLADHVGQVPCGDAPSPPRRRRRRLRGRWQRRRCRRHAARPSAAAALQWPRRAWPYGQGAPRRTCRAGCRAGCADGEPGARGVHPDAVEGRARHIRRAAAQHQLSNRVRLVGPWAWLSKGHGAAPHGTGVALRGGAGVE